MNRIETMFSYDTTAPLNIQEVGREMRDGITVKDITYTSPATGRPISAYLVMPEGGGQHPGILWVHWLEGGSPTSNRTQFLNEAVALAKEGVVSLLPQANWSTPGWFNGGRTLQSDYGDSVQQVVDLRRAFDVLLASGADADRLAYVGHDFGAMYGAIVAAVDRRAKLYVLIAGTKSFSDWFLFGHEALPADERQAYIEQMSVFDPTRHIAHTAPAFVYFQFGTDDVYVPQDAAAAFYEAASEPKAMNSYAIGHDMELDSIHADRLAILREHLGLGA